MPYGGAWAEQGLCLHGNMYTCVVWELKIPDIWRLERERKFETKKKDEPARTVWLGVSIDPTWNHQDMTD